jgi:uncharacterized membrane protein
MSGYVKEYRPISKSTLGIVYPARTYAQLSLATYGEFKDAGYPLAYVITADDYFKRTQPAKTEEIKNRVEIKVKKLTLSETKNVYTSPQEIVLASGATLDTLIAYSAAPVKGAIASLIEKSSDQPIIISSTYYAWGARIVIMNVAASVEHCKISISGKILVSESEEIVSDQDYFSVRDNGILKYTLPDNDLMQSKNMAQKIATALLYGYATARKDTSLDWRGNPALELGDVIQTPEYRGHALTVWGFFKVFKNTLNYDGTLRSFIEARKIVANDPYA